jgi:hypothetical protein
METAQRFKITVQIENRPDGGTRAWSDDVPGLVLSNASEDKVLHDIQPALELILTETFGCPIRLERLVTLEEVKAALAEERAEVARAVGAIKPSSRRRGSKGAGRNARSDRWEFAGAVCHA